jgi:hypothetical protein
MALTADLELRRRHPDAKLRSLAPAESAAAAGSPDGAVWISPALTVPPETTQKPAQIFLNIEGERFAPGGVAAARLAGLAELDIDPAVAGRLATRRKWRRVARSVGWAISRG